MNSMQQQAIYRLKHTKKNQIIEEGQEAFNRSGVGKEYNRLRARIKVLVEKIGVIEQQKQDLLKAAYGSSHATVWGTSGSVPETPEIRARLETLDMVVEEFMVKAAFAGKGADLLEAFQETLELM